MPTNASSATPKCPVCDVDMMYERQQRSGFGDGIGTDMKKVWRCPQLLAARPNKRAASVKLRHLSLPKIRYLLWSL